MSTGGNSVAASFLDVERVKAGDLSGLTEAELACYRAGEVAGVELAMSCVRGNRWRMNRIWQRVWEAVGSNG